MRTNPFVVVGALRHAPTFIIMSKIPITIEVEPDIVVIHEADSNYIKHQYVFSHDFCVIVECERSGALKKYAYPKYHGARIKDGKVEWLNPGCGWKIDELATKQYMELEAEKELLK